MDKLYSIIEVANKLGLSDKTLRRWEEAGKFSSTRTLGNQRRYTLEDLQILDALKHGTINKQADLLNIQQASQLCGVTPITISRWENDGKIHPFITSGNTYYPRQKLIEKMAELKKSYPEPKPEILPVPRGSDLDPKGVSKLSPLTKPTPAKYSIPYTPYFIQTLVTLILLLSYHLLFNQPSPPISPQGSVQGVTTTTDPRLDDLITKFQDFMTAQNLKDAKPLPVTTINLDNTSVIVGTQTLGKGSDHTTVTNNSLTPATTVTATFTADFSPAKKYWITSNQGSFTLTTDFPVGQDATFNYSFVAPTSTASAIITP